MLPKKMKKIFSLLIVLSLVFSLGINSYALDDSPDHLENLYENEFELVEEDDAAPDEELEDINVIPDDEDQTSQTESAQFFETLDNNPLIIKSVEVLNGGEVQILYNQKRYKS